jgi:hypothetical protein
VQRNAAAWLNRNDWYNPQANDKDSQIAKKMDELMVTEGWNPADPDYWDELDRRLQERLPHRYNQAQDGSERRNPRNVVGSSGREAPASFGGQSRNSFTLSAERVQAMKQAGIWDNPKRKAEAIRRYMDYDRNNRGN